MTDYKTQLLCELNQYDYLIYNTLLSENCWIKKYHKYDKEKLVKKIVDWVTQVLKNKIAKDIDKDQKEQYFSEILTQVKNQLMDEKIISISPSEKDIKCPVNCS